MVGTNGAAPGAVEKYDRFTMAKSGKEPVLKMIQRGAMPNTGKRQPKRRVK